MCLIPGLLGAPAFELNLIGLYLANLSSHSTSELRSLVTRHSTRGCQPIRNAFALIDQGLPEPVFPSSMELEHEPDEVPISY